MIAGWQVNAINTVYSGQPLTVLSGKDPLLNGDNLETADLVGNPSLTGGRAKVCSNCSMVQYGGYLRNRQLELLELLETAS